MIQYTIEACQKSKYEIEVWVSSDCDIIKNILNDLKINIHHRSEENSVNSAYKQAAIREAASHIVEKQGTPDLFLSLQANSPTMTSKEIDNCIDALIKYDRDEIISVDSNLMQDASIRVFRGNYVFQKDLSTNCGVVVTDLYDVHTIEDVKIVEAILKT